MEDKQILRMLWDRLEEAIDALAVKFGKGLYRLAMNILNNHSDSEETVNDTYMALWNRIPPEHPDPLTPYVYRTGRNTALNKLRSNTAQKRSSYYTVSLDELAQSLPGSSLDQQIDARLLGEAIDRWLEDQNQTNRTLFVRRYWYGDGVNELASLYAMTPGSISTRLNRLRLSLRDYLYKEGILE